jgi:uncharacterized membrane protein
MRQMARYGLYRLLGVCVVFLLATVAWSQSITWLGTTGGSSYALGVSNDGLTVVGAANGDAVVWDRAANTIITVYNGSSEMSGCDATGAIAVGLTSPSWYNIQTPFMWTRQSGFQWLPPYPNLGWCADITPSGAYAVGKARSPSGYNLPALWDLRQDPPVLLTYAVGVGMDHGEAYGISDDGRTIVVFGHGSGWGYRGVVFRLKPDFTVDWWSYLMPISGHYGCVPREISENGSVAVGISGNVWGGSYYPAMWRAANNWAPELLANLGGNAGVAWDIRGGVIIGFSTTPSGEQRAVRWQLGTATTQVEDLNQTYAALLTDGSVLRSANAFSANGRYIVGWGYNAATRRDEAFLLDTRKLAVIRGTLTLGDYGGDPSLVPVSVRLRKEGGSEETRTIFTDRNGNYSLWLEPGAYEVSFKASHWLRVNLTGVTLDVAEELTGQNVTLTNGDIDGDNEVTLFDFGELVAAFGSMPGDENWNPNADLDGDEEVTLFDFGILVQNFGAIGDE